MMTRASVLVVAAFVAGVYQSTAAQAPRPTAPPKASFFQPGISPDGREIAFVSAGDIWIVAAGGGDARLLVAHAASDERPLYSPDGSRIAFMSNRSGNMDIWVLTLATGQMARLTTDDGTEQLDTWSRDSEWIYFSSNSDVYRVRARGGTPMPVSADRDLPESMAAAAPDGTSLTVVARGLEFEWWRRGRSHADESELWRVRIDGANVPTYELISPGGAKQQWPMYTAGGEALYFVSDRSGQQNLWVKPTRGEARMVTSFPNGRVMWPTMSADGHIAFERDFGIWLYTPASRSPREVPISLHGAALADPVVHLSLTTNFTDLAASPDGRKVAFVAHGEVFAASASDGGDAVRVTRTPAAETQVTWSPDSRKLAYAANRAGTWQLYLYDFVANTETPLTEGARNAILPQFAPDGRTIAFIREATELCVLTLDSRTARVVAQGFFGRPPLFAQRPIAWSPDSRWIAYLSAGARTFQNAWIVPATGGDARQVTWLADTPLTFPYTSSLSWSSDGTFLLFNTGARNDPGQMVRVDLLPRTPKFREDQFIALFRDGEPRQSPDAPKAPSAEGGPLTARGTAATRDLRIDFDGIRQRLTVIPIGLDVGPPVLSPDGKTVVVPATVGGQQNLFSYSLDDLAAEPPVTRQVTTTPAAKTAVQFASDGKSVWYLEGGRLTSTSLEPRANRALAVRAELDVDFPQEKWEVFHQAWEYLNENFYDPSFHGIDWNGVHAAYAPRIAGARTSDEMRRILLLMVGEMNASHMGVIAPPSGVAAVVGQMGLDFDRVAYETRGEFRITFVVPLGPAAVAGIVQVGDVILDIGGTPLGVTTNLSALLAHTIGRKVTLTVAADSSGRERRTVSLRPIVWSDDNQLRYRASVQQRRAMVSRLSAGRLGYVHIPAMRPATLAQLYLDLDAENQEKEGVIIDIRNNGGGATNGHVLDLLMRKPYIDMAQRGLPAVSGRYFLGQRALQAPTILITNQQTYSDAENFTEGYRVLNLGKVVGEPTAGADIYTTFGVMVDGTVVRLPYMRSSQLDRATLELVPRKVDVLVNRPLGESYAGRDSQLEVAVKELLAQIGSSLNRVGQR